MTAEVVVLAGERVGAMVSAAARVCGVADLRLAIVGGVAVTCRLGHSHRATGDVDAVGDEIEAVGPNARALVARGIASTDPGGVDHRVFVDGTKFEIIDTVALPEEVGEIEPPGDRLFVLGHRWALDSAEQTRVLVTGTDVDVVLPIAIPAALVATKLHAFLDRREERKRASDAYDIFRLLETHDGAGGVADSVLGGPQGLATVVEELAREKFVDEAERVVRYLRSYGDSWEEIGADDIRRVVGAFVRRLRVEEVGR